MDINKKYKPVKSPIFIEALETEHTYHSFVMPKMCPKPKHVADFTAKFVEFFDMKDANKGASSSIYRASEFSHKVYKVNLRGELSWKEYYSKLKEIQPDIKILDVFCTSQKGYISKNPLFQVFGVSHIKIGL